MYDEKRSFLWNNYHAARDFLVAHPEILIELEWFTTELVNQMICNHYDEIEHDYNEASYLNPFWANYPPDDRGRAPVGDQVPWIEVGEHAVGHKLSRLIAMDHDIAEIGLPSGADNRFVLVDDEILSITQGLTDQVFVFLDIKSVGPRDNFAHTVISPYQVSGDGRWECAGDNVENSTIQAVGKMTSHTFYPAIPPIYALTDGSVAPTMHLFVKPIYRMLGAGGRGRTGQPLEGIKNICVPNGLLLCINPDYLQEYPGLFYPGKDDKNKDPRKIRVRVSFDVLHRIAPWRVSEFYR